MKTKIDKYLNESRGYINDAARSLESAEESYSRGDGDSAFKWLIKSVEYLSGELNKPKRP